MLVAIGIGEECVGIDDTLVKDDFVALGFFHRREGLGVGISFDLVRVVDSEFSRVVFGFHDLSRTFCFSSYVIQLHLSPRVEEEPAYLAFDFLVVRLVAVILRASGSEFDDMFAGLELAGEFFQMVAQGQHGLTVTMREDEGIGVEVQHLFGQESTQSLSVEFQPGPACGETGHEDVDVDLDRLFLVHMLVDHFDHLVVHDA